MWITPKEGKVPERTKSGVFYQLLKEIKKRHRQIKLDEWEHFQRAQREALSETKRYKKYTRLGGCATYTESVLDHIVNTAFLCDVMLGIEEDRGIYIRFLNTELLRLAARIHDLPEALTDDIDIMDKRQADEDDEGDAFGLIIAGLPRATQSIYRKAYAISQEWHTAGAKRRPETLRKISKNGRFFAALEIVGYLSRGFLEVAAGNKVFANIFHNWERHLVILQREFVSVQELLGLLKETVEKYKEDNPYFEE